MDGDSDLNFIKERLDAEHDFTAINIKLLRASLRALLAKGLLTQDELIRALHVDAEAAVAGGASPQRVQQLSNSAHRMVQSLVAQRSSSDIASSTTAPKSS